MNISDTYTVAIISIKTDDGGIIWINFENTFPFKIAIKVAFECINWRTLYKIILNILVPEVNYYKTNNYNG